MSKAIKNNDPILLRALILFSIFVIMILPYVVLMRRLLTVYPILSSAAQVSIPLFGNLPGLDILGFVAPLFTTLLIILIRVKNVKSISRSLHALILRFKWWYVASLTAILISFLIPTLSASGRTDYPLAIVAVTYVAINIRQGTMGDRMLSSFVFGYAVGFISDLQSQVFFTGYFGGGGWVDGDFILPIFLCLAAAISRVLIEFLEPYAGKKNAQRILERESSGSNHWSHSANHASRRSIRRKDVDFLNQSSLWIKAYGEFCPTIAAE